MNKKFDEYLQVVLNINKERNFYDEKLIKENDFFFINSAQQNVSESEALLSFDNYLKDTKSEITSDEFLEFMFIQHKYATLYRKTEIRVENMLKTIWPEEEFIIDDIVFFPDSIQIWWGKIDPFDNNIDFPKEWLFDDNWYKKYKEIES